MLIPVLERYSVDGITSGDLGLLCAMGPEKTVDLLRRCESLREAGYSLTALRRTTPRGAIANLKDYVHVGETAKARGRAPSQVDESDWLLKDARENFGRHSLQINFGPSRQQVMNDDLKAELALLVQADIRAELQRLGTRGDELRTILEKHPVEGLCVAEVKYLSDLGPRRAADLLRRYESLYQGGYTLTVLRDSTPGWIPGEACFGDFVAVGEAAKSKGHGPSQIADRDWFLAEDGLDQSTRRRLRDNTWR